MSDVEYLFMCLLATRCLLKVTLPSKFKDESNFSSGWPHDFLVTNWMQWKWYQVIFNIRLEKAWSFFKAFFWSCWHCIRRALRESPACCFLAVSPFLIPWLLASKPFFYHSPAPMFLHSSPPPFHPPGFSYSYALPCHVGNREDERKGSCEEWLRWGVGEGMLETLLHGYIFSPDKTWSSVGLF